MTELEKMKMYHSLETIREMPEAFQTMNLVVLCKMDPTGRMERLARILAKYDVPAEKVVPCIIEIFQDMLIDEGGK